MNKSYIFPRFIYGVLALFFSLASVNGIIVLIILLFSPPHGDNDPRVSLLFSIPICGVIAFFLFRRWLFWHKMARLTLNKVEDETVA